MPLPQLIALYAPAMGSGKSTVSKILEEEFSYTPIKFAGTIKKMVSLFIEELGIPPQDVHRYIEGDLKERHMDGIRVTPRYLMQTLGNEWGREYVDDGVWIALAMRRIRKAKTRVVVDDLRFPAEYEALKAEGALMVKVTRPGAAPVNSHVSEGRLDSHSWDVEIANGGTLEELAAVVRSRFVQHTL